MYASGRCEERMGHALNSSSCPVDLSEIRVTTKSGRQYTRNLPLLVISRPVF